MCLPIQKGEDNQHGHLDFLLDVDEWEQTKKRFHVKKTRTPIYLTGIPEHAESPRKSCGICCVYLGLIISAKMLLTAWLAQQHRQEITALYSPEVQLQSLNFLQHFRRIAL